MRIISGIAKGRKLAAPPARDMAIRPTADRAKEALFSIIGSRVVGARVLDLFAGTGALGCESLSRGAASAVFVDNSRAACELIKKNIGLLPGSHRNAQVLRQDLSRGLGPKLCAAENCFDLVFADPPYQKGFSEKILQSLDLCPVLSERVLVILEEKKDVSLPEQLEHLSLDFTRRYGDTRFAFYRLTSKPPISANGK